MGGGASKRPAFPTPRRRRPLLKQRAHTHRRARRAPPSSRRASPTRAPRSPPHSSSAPSPTRCAAPSRSVCFCLCVFVVVRARLSAAPPRRACRRSAFFPPPKQTTTPTHSCFVSLPPKKTKPQLQFPPFPTTTIGSFPQTADVRRLRAQLKAGRLSRAEYEAQVCVVCLGGWVGRWVCCGWVVFGGFRPNRCRRGSNGGGSDGVAAPNKKTEHPLEIKHPPPKTTNKNNKTNRSTATSRLPSACRRRWAWTCSCTAR